MSLRSYASLTAAAALIAAPFIVATAPSPSTAATSAGSDVQASSINCTSAIKAPYSQTQGSASVPVCANNTWVYDIPATSAPQSPRRTETHWGTATSVGKYYEGQTVTHEATYNGILGAAGQGDSDWHVIWQLHGPMKDGSWPGPAMGLNVRNGMVRLGGGAGHPLQNWSTRNYEWIKVLGTWTDGKPVKVKVQTYLSSDPNRGWVSAWVNGRQVLNQYRPTSYKGGLKPGTFYAGMDHVVSRSGLYRGTQAGTPPTYRQVMSVSVNRAG